MADHTKGKVAIVGGGLVRKDITHTLQYLIDVHVRL